MKVVNQNPERLYSKYYHDFMKSKLFDGKEKIVFLMLKMFGDFRTDNGGTTATAYPTQSTLAEYLGMTRKTVGKILQQLESKGVVKSLDQGKDKPKLYYIYDYQCLWESETHEDLAEAAKAPEKMDHILALQKLGYKIIPPSEESSTIASESSTIAAEKANDAAEWLLNDLDPQKKEKPAQENPNADFKNSSPIKYNNKIVAFGQVEQHSLDEVKTMFDYDIMMMDHPHHEKMIDGVFNLIYETLNEQDPFIKVQRKNRPAAIVKNRLMKLDKDSIIYCIDKFSERSNRIKYPKAYLLTQLYEAPDQFEFDLVNQVNHDLYGA